MQIRLVSTQNPTLIALYFMTIMFTSHPCHQLNIYVQVIECYFVTNLHFFLNVSRKFSRNKPLLNNLKHF